MFFVLFFFFNDTATTEIYTLSLHDALPIFPPVCRRSSKRLSRRRLRRARSVRRPVRSEEHTSELQSHHDLVCRLLLEKKKERPTAPTEPWTPVRLIAGSKRRLPPFFF